jgi:hypothetical protein
LDTKTAEERRTFINSIVRHKRVLQKSQSQEDNMSYNIRIPARRMESMFGAAYPSLSLKYSQKCAFLAVNLSGVTGCTPPSNDFDSRSQISVEIEKSNKFYTVNVNVRGTKGYNVAIAAEKWLTSKAKLRRPGVSRFYNRIFRSNTPVDSYMIPSNKAADVLLWLIENCTINDYQLYSKFGSDTSVGFRNTESSTLFKLTFADVVG